MTRKLKITYTRGDKVGTDGGFPSFFPSFFILIPIHEPIRSIVADNNFGKIAVTSFSRSGTLNISVIAAQTLGRKGSEYEYHRLKR